MVSLFFGLVWALCLLLIAVWPRPVVTPFDRQYHDWDHNPAWQRFKRQRRRYYVLVGAVAIIASASIFFATGLLAIRLN